MRSVGFVSFFLFSLLECETNNNGNNKRNNNTTHPSWEKTEQKASDFARPTFFATLKLSNLTHDVLELHKISWSPDCETAKLWKGRSGAWLIASHNFKEHDEVFWNRFRAIITDGATFRRRRSQKRERKMWCKLMLLHFSRLELREEFWVHNLRNVFFCIFNCTVVDFGVPSKLPFFSAN